MSRSLATETPGAAAPPGGVASAFERECNATANSDPHNETEQITHRNGPRFPSRERVSEHQNSRDDACQQTKR